MDKTQPGLPESDCLEDSIMEPSEQALQKLDLRFGKVRVDLEAIQTSELVKILYVVLVIFIMHEKYFYL